MKRVLIITLLILSKLLFAQTEQISLDFFAEKILPQLKNTKVYYNGKIIEKVRFEEIKKNNDDETLIEMILWDYSMCKNDPRGLNNSNFDFRKNFDLKNLIAFANVKNSNAKNLKTPKNITFKEKLVNKTRKAGKLRNKIKKLFAQKYNLKISPSIQINENTYLTRIYLTKQDFEHGSNYDIVVINGNIADWCENYWIQ